MEKDKKKKKTVKTAKKMIKKTEKSAKKPVKKPAVKKIAAKKPAQKALKPAVKKTVKISVKPVKKDEKKTVKPMAIIPSTSIKKDTKPVISHIPETQPVISPEKTDIAEAPAKDLSLPEGSVYQQTGQRRPLIVFPK